MARRDSVHLAAPRRRPSRSASAGRRRGAGGVSPVVRRPRRPWRVGGGV